METKEQTFTERLKQIEIEQSVKVAKINLLLDLTQSINELGICVDCNHDEFRFTETNAQYKLCEEIFKIINKEIEKLK